MKTKCGAFWEDLRNVFVRKKYKISNFYFGEYFVWCDYSGKIVRCSSKPNGTTHWCVGHNISWLKLYYLDTKTSIKIAND